MRENDIIVVSTKDRKTKVAAERMSNIISEFVREESGISCCHWDEKIYLQNKSTLSSKQYVIQLGLTKDSSILTESIIPTYDEHNMKFGWIGRKAVIWIDYKELSKVELDKVEDLIRKQNNEIKKGNFFSNLNKGIIRSGTLSKIITTYFLLPLGLYAIIAGEKDKKNIQSKQFRYLVNLFLKKHLNEFLGIKE